MSLAAQRELEHIGESRGCEDHDHDLVHELGKRLDALWRYDQYLANASDKTPIQELWRDLKEQETDNINRIKQLIRDEVEHGCF